MRPGDALILSKPIGTGTLFAAHARLQARGRWIDAALAVDAAIEPGWAVRACSRTAPRACTDLTGFGLLGHLLEMTRPSAVDAEIDLAALPLLDGAAEMAAAGILSSLQPANVRLRRALQQPAGGAAARQLSAALRSADRRRPARQRAGGQRRGVHRGAARAAVTRTLRASAACCRPGRRSNRSVCASDRNAYFDLLPLFARVQGEPRERHCDDRHRPRREEARVHRDLCARVARSVPAGAHSGRHFARNDLPPTRCRSRFRAAQDIAFAHRFPKGRLGEPEKQPRPIRAAVRGTAGSHLNCR
jgi:hypothetical protein